MEKSATVKKAEYLLKRLLFDPSKADLLRDYRWPSESDRWNELVFALISRVCQRPEAELRELTHYLADLGHLQVSQLAQIGMSGDEIDPTDEEAQRILGVFRERGVADQQASGALSLLCQLARGLEANFASKIQHYLRSYGEAMLADIPRYFSFRGISDEDIRCAFAYWLQEALSMPVSLQGPSLDRFCQENSITASDLWEAADNLDVNVAIVDDLVGLSEAGMAEQGDEEEGET